MTLVLTVDWSADSTSATVFDIAARSIVGEGRTLHPAAAADSEELPDPWWSALVDAISTALDSIAALGLTVSDIRLLVLSSADPAALLEHLDARSARSETASAVDVDLDWSAMFPAVTDAPRSVGRLSDDAAIGLDLPAGLPLFASTTIGA